jgi:hypothetical protein
MTRTAKQVEQEERDAERLLVAAKHARRRLPRVEVFDWPPRQRPKGLVTSPTLGERAKAVLAQFGQL